MLSTRARLSLLAAAAALAVAGQAFASPRLTVAIDHAERLMVARPAGSVIVGNPAVADVTVVDGRTLYVTGKGYGVSQVIVLDPLGRTVWQGDVVVTAPVDGQVSVYRGGQATEMACSTICAPNARQTARAAGAGGASSSGSGGSAPPLTPMTASVQGGTAQVASRPPS